MDRKQLLTIAGAFVAALALSGGPVQAHPGHEKGVDGAEGGELGSRRSQRLLERFDADNDGELSDEEREAIPRRRAARRGPRGRFRGRGPGRHLRRGSDEAVEREEGQGERRRFRQRGRFRRRHELDGVDSDQEVQKSRRPARGRRGPRRDSALLKRFDSNNDGVLDREERRTLRQALHARGGARRALRAEAENDGEGKNRTGRKRRGGGRRCRCKKGEASGDSES